MKFKFTLGKKSLKFKFTLCKKPNNFVTLKANQCDLISELVKLIMFTTKFLTLYYSSKFSFVA